MIIIQKFIKIPKFPGRKQFMCRKPKRMEIQQNRIWAAGIY